MSVVRRYKHRRVQRLIVFAHIIAVATYFGATVFLATLIGSVGEQAPDAVARRHRFVALLRVYNPLSIAALGVVVVTGAWSITPYKEALGAGYFAAVGSAMVGKLGLAFLLIIMATWVSFGIGHRLVRAHLGALPVTDVDLRRVAMRLRVGLWLTVVVALATLWVALGIHPPSLNG